MKLLQNQHWSLCWCICLVFSIIIIQSTPHQTQAERKPRPHYDKIHWHFTTASRLRLWLYRYGIS